MMRLRWPAWRGLAASERASILAEASDWLSANPQTAVFSMLGHKADLMLIHYRPGFDALNAAELALARLRLNDYLEPMTSYLSVVELGLYESTGKIYKELTEKGLLPHTPEWNAAMEETLDRQRKAMAVRLYPEFPPTKYVCFYPMDRRRGETKNWYQVPFAERAHMMHDHGMIGRRYAGEVKQIISGSIGFDDWEWGVDLYADDPLVFKKLIYEMRFDPVSAMYALFGTFYVGLRVPATELAGLLG
ncbi:MAG: heme-dependent peroxidase [Bryobacteraceae bacterium]|nr:heme-dependent peroxidase [Bryobacteraceae bacterium]